MSLTLLCVGRQYIFLVRYAIYISFTEYKSLHDSHNTCDLYTYEVCQRVSGVCD